MQDAGGRTYRIGCSGWNYASWRHGVFYPERCPARLWLDFYARHFDTVEVNATFYRLPTVKAVQGWVDQTPADFVFAVKLSRYVTHVKRLRDLGPSLERFYERIEPLVRSGKLGALLWQLPPTFKRDDERLAQALAEAPPGRHCVEFRHESWFAPDVMALLREHGVALVIGDRPEVRRFPDPRADDRLDVRPLPSRHAWRARQLLRVRAPRVGRTAALVAGRRGVRVLQQRLGRLRTEERTAAPRTPGYHDSGIEFGTFLRASPRPVTHAIPHPDADVATILVCDDDPSLRELVRAVLGSGYRFIEAADGTEALAAARELDPDLIVLDVMLPGLSGIEVLEEIRSDEKLKDMPVVVITAWSHTEIEAQVAGADRFVSKPFDPDELSNVVAELLA